MNEKELITRISRLGPTKTQKERMLSRILEPEAPKKAPLKRSYKIAIPAICCAMLSLALILPMFLRQESAIPSLVALSVQPSPQTFTPRQMPLQAAIDPLKMMSFNGYRYTFLSDGAPYDLSGMMPTPGDKLSDDDQDFATTYLAGGTLYRLQGYDPGFRIAVEHQGRYYIAQMSGRTDDVTIPAEEYVNVADLVRLTEKIDIMNHSGSLHLHSLDGKNEVRKWIEMFSRSESSVNRDREDDEQWAKAQSEGKSYLAKLRLKDGTAIDMYVVPELGAASLGDNRYGLPESFQEAYADLFHNP
ncbi:hypothetical protein [Paenibacillus paeoniae]|uniref:Uncharacterized protein n=1 Tax=Paenibacillus paeoniae TaxID=2292705 RepID=A0A371PNF0_9BACL|nr:hypothetical protein [Paenibacillus paeoniae]REK77653.1 hypothetical protein DX130_11855 [Paenibacillus paeoniae]